jgi:hypothetical protein
MSAWVKIYQNGATVASMILIINAAGTRELGLAVGDRVFLRFDARRNAIGLKKDETGSCKLYHHGSNTRILKLSIAGLFREHLAPVGVVHGTRLALLKGKGGWLTAPLVVQQSDAVE